MSQLTLGYGGLASNAILGVPADGSIIANWDAVTPLQGTPLQTTPDKVAGTITTTQQGTYTVDFSANISALTSNQDYDFRINLNGVDRKYGGLVGGSNSVDSQSLSFSILVTVGTGAVIGISVLSGGGGTFTINSASLTVTRIG